MDEFTSIAIWLMMAILAINASIVWFANTPTFTNPDLGLAVPDVTHSPVFISSDVNKLKESYYQPEEDKCSQIDASLSNVGPCIFQTAGNIFKPVGDVVNLMGGFVQDLWNFFFAWSNVLNQISAQFPSIELFVNIFKIILGLIEVSAIVVITLRVVSIIRGTGSGA